LAKIAGAFGKFAVRINTVKLSDAPLGNSGGGD
jgi:hypothetical protein